jgi:hypothetical protein
VNPKVQRNLKIFHRELDDNEPSTLPWREYFDCAYYRSRELVPEPVRDVAHRVIRTPLFEFVRLAKSHPELIGVPAQEALMKVEYWVANLRGIPKAASDRWYFLFRTPKAEATMELFDAWQRVRYPPGWSPLDLAILRARSQPLDVKNSPTPGFAEFVSVCYWLQRSLNKDIALPEELLAKKLGVSQPTVSRYRQEAQRRGLLRLIEHHSFRPDGKGRATRFRFAMKRFPQYPLDGSDDALRE